MGKYGNIDGIATLTGDSIARDNVRGTIGRLLSAREKAAKDRKTVRVEPVTTSKSTKKGTGD